jgi:hypothetical protein
MDLLGKDFLVSPYGGAFCTGDLGRQRLRLEPPAARPAATFEPNRSAARKAPLARALACYSERPSGRPTDLVAGPCLDSDQLKPRPDLASPPIGWGSIHVISPREFLWCFREWAL